MPPLPSSRSRSSSPSPRSRSPSPPSRSRSHSLVKKLSVSASDHAKYGGGYGGRSLKYRALAKGGSVVTSTIMKVPNSTCYGLDSRIVVVNSDGQRQIVSDSATVVFNKEQFSIDFEIDRFKEGADKLPLVLEPVEITASRDAFRWVVTTIEKRLDGMFVVYVVGGPPFVTKGITAEESINLNGPSINLFIYDEEPREEPIFKGNYVDGRFWQSNGDPMKRFKNCSNMTLGNLVEMRQKDIRRRLACEGRVHAPGICMHPGCDEPLWNHEIYCEEAGCAGGGACSVKGKHGACFSHGYPCSMMHPVRIISDLE